MIHIDTLSIRDFMGVRAADFDFRGNDAVLMSGDNGSGKSSIMKAIVLCLTGSKSVGIEKASELVYEDAKSAYVKMTATVAGKPMYFDFVVRGEDERGGTTRSVGYDGTTYANTEVDALLKSLDLQYYGQVMLSKQGDGDVTRLGAAARLDYMSKLLQFDLSKEIEEITEARKEIEDERVRRDESSRVKENEAARLESVKHEKVTVPDYDVVAITEDVARLTSEVSRVTEGLARRSAVERELREVNEELANAERLVSRAREEAAIEAERTKHDESKKEEARGLLEQADAKHEESLVLSAEARTAENAALEAEDEVIVLEKASSVAYASFLETKRKADLVAGGKCPTCGRDTHDAFEHAAVDVDAAKKKYDDAKELVSKVKAIAKEKRDAFYEKKRTYDLRKQDESHLRERSASVLASIREKKAVRRVSVDTTSLEEKKKELTATLGSFGPLPDLREINSKLESSRSMLAEHDAAVRHNALADEAARKDAQRIKTLREEVETDKKEAGELALRVADYDAARVILRDSLPQHMVLKTSADIERRMNATISQVFPEWRVVLSPHRSGLDFKFSKGGKYHSVNVASGFEKETLSVAFRVALCESYGLDLLVLDECDSQSSKEKSQKLFEAIFGSGSFVQVFVISHKDEVRDVLENVASNLAVYSAKDGRFTRE